MLANAADWTVGVGHPGYANAAVDEIFNRWILSRMFAEAARSRMSPEQAVGAAVKEAQKVYDRWQQAGKV